MNRILILVFLFVLVVPGRSIYGGAGALQLNSLSPTGPVVFPADQNFDTGIPLTKSSFRGREGSTLAFNLNERQRTRGFQVSASGNVVPALLFAQNRAGLQTPRAGYQQINLPTPASNPPASGRNVVAIQVPAFIVVHRRGAGGNALNQANSGNFASFSVTAGSPVGSAAGGPGLSVSGAQGAERRLLDLYGGPLADGNSLGGVDGPSLVLGGQGGALGF